VLVPVLCAATALASCARLGGPAPVVAHGASGPSRPGLAPVPAAPVESVPGDIIVQHGDTLYGVARRANAPMRAIIDANHLQPPYVLHTGQHLTVPRVRSYTVQAGDTLSGLARRYGVGTSDLVRANALPPPYNLQTGQVLVLPPGAVVPPTAVAAAPSPTPAAIAREPLPVLTSPGRSPPAVESAALPTSGPPSAPATPVTPPVNEPPHVTSATPTPAPAPAFNPPPISTLPPMPVETPQPASLTVTKPIEPAPADAAPLHGGRFLWPVRGTVVSDYGTKPGGLQNDGINISAPRGTPIRAADSGVVVYAGNELRGFGNLLLVKHHDGWVTAYAHADELLVHRGDEVRRGQVVARVGSTGGVSSPQVHFEVRKGSRPLNPRDYLGPQTASASP